MPCNSWGPSEGEVGAENDRLIREVNQLTQMLCAACGYLESVRTNIAVAVPQLADWWLSHKNLDRVRIAKQLAEASYQLQSLEAKERESAEAVSRQRRGIELLLKEQAEISSRQ